MEYIQSCWNTSYKDSRYSGFLRNSSTIRAVHQFIIQLFLDYPAIHWVEKGNLAESLIYPFPCTSSVRLMQEVHTQFHFHHP